MDSTALETSYRLELNESWQGIESDGQQRMFLLGVLAAATTLNDENMLSRWIQTCKGVLKLEAIEESILQTLLFAGFPKTIEALKILRQIYPESSGSRQIESRTQSGEDTSKIVYGEYHDRLKQVMDELHPDLTRWMIEDGYGRILSRPGLSLQEREIAVLGSLMASGMIHQFRAHIRGALNAGIKPVDIIWFTNTFKCILAADLRRSFEVITKQVVEGY